MRRAAIKGNGTIGGRGTITDGRGRFEGGWEEISLGGVLRLPAQRNTKGGRFRGVCPDRSRQDKGHQKLAVADGAGGV